MERRSDKYVDEEVKTETKAEKPVQKKKKK